MTPRKLNEKCAVLAIYAPYYDVARMAYYGLYSLQHRGQESSGIVTSDGRQFYSHLGQGLVSHVYQEEDLRLLHGHMAVGHNRYSTSGGNVQNHTQPIILPDINLSFAHNGNLPSTKALERFLDDHGIEYASSNDSAMMALAIGFYMDSGLSLPDAVDRCYPLFTGAFACVAMDDKQIVAFRDPCGIRPLSIATLDKGFVVASETCAFDTVGAGYLRDVQPGEMVIIDKHGLRSRQLIEPNLKLDIFELVYFARPDSLLLGRRVGEVRKAFGRRLAEEHNLRADIVIPMPDSAIPAAIGYAQAAGIPFDHGLIKNRYIHRTFIRPTAQLRQQDLQLKLNPIPEVIMGKNVVVVDDSIVRGTTTKKVVHMLHGAGARSVSVLISSPPVKYPDFYGIDTPKQVDLIAANLSVKK
ncbi:MAG TPA: amidophosphoribosyltransferase, partial [Candidatus Nanoarchaeia archaeon]|nr:amidophosphoribosyltransferase [Candidatus Nanoarchaeia archaeon]